MNRTIFDCLAGCRRLRLEVRLERTASSLSIHKDKDISYICGSKWKCVKIVRKDLVVPVRNSHSTGERGDPKIFEIQYGIQQSAFLNNLFLLTEFEE